MSDTELIFKKVKFSGFYKKAHDGKFINLNKDTLTADLVDSNLTGNTLEEGIIEKDIERAEKTYFEYVKANGKGIVVGVTELVVVGYLDVTYQDECDVGVCVIPEKFYVTKEAKETVKCAVVYYANNLKHFVPLDSIEIMEQKGESA